jgi:DNA polymerase/3'-5' exonuclease PolX
MGFALTNPVLARHVTKALLAHVLADASAATETAEALTLAEALTESAKALAGTLPEPLAEAALHEAARTLAEALPELLAELLALAEVGGNDTARLWHDLGLHLHRLSEALPETLTAAVVGHRGIGLAGVEHVADGLHWLALSAVGVGC